MKYPGYLRGSFLCVVAALFCNGCTTATSALWGRKVYHPSETKDVSLWFSPSRRDLLVRYCEDVNDSTNSQLRAYWLFASTNSASSTEAPIFVNQTNYDELVSVPVLGSRKGLKDVDSETGYCAIDRNRGLSFDFRYRESLEVWRDGGKIGKFKLPEYTEWEGRNTWRVALTPLAVTGDAALTACIPAAELVYITQGRILLLIPLLAGCH
ncbi:MAG TPA: hypothetical protein VN281_15585 [Verrucomicrobiae bacterium]|nr:hypothetical protein [Verrucomicrobiae bacterium]